CSWIGCTKAFMTPSLLKRHYTAHTGEKPFKCPFCPHATTQKCHLKLHVRSLHASLVKTSKPN
ncbi:hypothetical protein CAPTEDRAFT_130857, partial [Capitella teleta]